MERPPDSRRCTGAISAAKAGDLAIDVQKISLLGHGHEGTKFLNQGEDHEVVQRKLAPVLADAVEDAIDETRNETMRLQLRTTLELRFASAVDER